MKNIFCIVFLLLSSISFAQISAAFNQGNGFYNEGKFQEAITTYETILDNGKHSSELYFNLANAYYKTNQIAPSIYYYEKALQLAPNDKDIRNNLTFAQNMTIDAIDTIPEVGFSKLVKNIVSTFNFDVWAMLAVTFMILFVILFLSYYFSFGTNSKRATFLGSFASLFLALLALFFAFQKQGLVQNDNPAIVFAQETQVKTEPNLRGENAFDLHEGTKVQVIENYDANWTKIKLSDGKMGWISAEDIKAL